MRRVHILCLLAWVFAFFPAPLPAAAASPVFIREVHIDGATTDDDFIELYNPSENCLDISGYQLRKKIKSGTVSSVNQFPKGSFIAPAGTFLWANTKSSFKDLSDTATSATLAKDYSLALYTDTEANGGLLIDSVSWGAANPFQTASPLWPNNPDKHESLERSLSGQWSLNTEPSPSKSSPCPPKEAAPLPSNSIPLSIFLNEILPHPEEGQEEFIELRNDGQEKISLEGWSLADASKTGRYLFPASAEIPPHGLLVIAKTLFKFALNDSNESLKLIDPLGNIGDSLNYGKTRQGVSLNRAVPKWRGGTPTPGEENVLNALPTTKEKAPKKGYRDIPTDFDARGSDPEKQSLKFVWDFGDGHKSYKERTTHTYRSRGTYVVTLVTRDDKDETSEKFTIEVGEYRPPKIRIIALLPNPAGKDTDQEWIRLENKSGKRVNLKGFSIATGSNSEKLVNHPIKGDFWIGPRKSSIITREDALFTLPNQKGRVELRAPDKNVLDKVRYRYGKSIPEDLIYRKNSRKEWVWQEEAESVNEETLTEANKPQEISEEETLEEELLPAVLGRSTEEELALKQALFRLFAPPAFQDLPLVSERESPLSEKEKDPFGSFQNLVNLSLNILSRPQSD